MRLSINLSSPYQLFMEMGIFDLIEDDKTVFEKYPLEQAAKMGQLNAYRHNGFWQPMDMLRDKIELTKLWESGNAPWARWQKD